MTGEDFAAPDRHDNFSNTMARLLELGVVPVINENDTVATEEIRVGDNDTLSALVAVSVSADMLVLLSDIEGLYTADPHQDPQARLIPEIRELTEQVLALGGGAGSSLGTGGMRTKLHAAGICMERGCDMVIANGENPSLLYDIAEGKPVGTKFTAKK